MILLLKELRTQRGLTQSALSKRSGIRQGFISEIEAGKKEPSLETAYRLAQALDVELGELVRREDPDRLVSKTEN